MPASLRVPRMSMNFRLLLSGLLLAACAAQAADDTAQWLLQARTNRHSDFGSLSDLDADDPARFHARGGRNLAYMDDEVRVQRTQGPWGIALLARSTATLHATGETVEAYRHARRVGRDASDHHWRVDGRLRGFTGGGLELSRTIAPGGEWSGLVLVQALALTRWRDRRVVGTADFAAASATYAFDLRSSEVNDRLDFPFQRSHAPRGAALLFGADVRWQRGDWTLTGSVRDLGWLYWKRVPQQDFTLSSSTQAIDENGFVIYRPLLQGRNSQGGLTRGAPVRLAAAARWETRPRHAWTLATDYVQDFGLLPSLAWAQPLGPVQTELDWRFHERRLTLGLAWEGWRLRVGADRIGDVRSRLLELRYQRAL